MNLLKLIIVIFLISFSIFAKEVSKKRNPQAVESIEKANLGKNKVALFIANTASEETGSVAMGFEGVYYYTSMLSFEALIFHDILKPKRTFLLASSEDMNTYQYGIRAYSAANFPVSFSDIRLLSKVGFGYDFRGSTSASFNGLIAIIGFEALFNKLFSLSAEYLNGLGGRLSCKGTSDVTSNDFSATFYRQIGFGLSLRIYKKIFLGANYYRALMQDNIRTLTSLKINFELD